MSVQNTTMMNAISGLTFDKPTLASATPQNTSPGVAPPVDFASPAIISAAASNISPSYQTLSEATAKLNAVADSVRQADVTMESIGRTVDRMKGALEGIVKNFPPFPPGSEKRVALLKTFSGLRNEIEKLTFPPEPSLVPQLIADPAKAAGTFSVPIAGSGTNVQLDRQRVDPGPGGLNIPVLPVAPPEDSGDKPIHATLAALATASSVLNDRRQALSENFARQTVSAVAVSISRQTGISDSAQSSTMFSEQAALSQSRNLQGVFSALPVGISSGRDSFMREML